MMNAAQLINQTSGDFEYYTPPEIIDAARVVMGDIDLDPASSVAANERVKAGRFYTVADDGLSLPWFGRVWLNHPFGRGLNDLWISKIVQEYAIANIEEALCITYACTSEKWFQPLLPHKQCFISPRTNYYLPDGSLKKGVTKGSVVTYFGDNSRRFATVFEAFGVVK